MPSPSKLNRAFLYANFGPQVCKLLAEDNTYARVFPVLPDIKDYKKFSPQERTKILDVFVEATCPHGAQTSPQILRWAFNQYLTHLHNGKPMQAEDFYKIKDNLSYFDSLKQSQPFKNSGHSADLLQYKTYADFEQMLAPFIKQKQLKEEAARQFNISTEKRAKIMAETTVLYQGPEGMVVIPHTPESSQHWGSNTRWCISGKEADQGFPDYNQTSPVIMIIPSGMQDQKIALVYNTLYDSADKKIDAFPPEHDRLLQKSLARLSPAARKGIDPWVQKILGAPAKKKQKITDEEQQAITETLQALDIKKTPNAKLWSDRKFVLVAVQLSGVAFRFAHPDLKSDREFVLAVVQKSGSALEFAHPDFRKDRDIVLAAVERDGLALKYACEDYQKDPDIVLTAGHKFIFPLLYAHPDLQNDKNFINQFLRQVSVDSIFLPKDEIDCALTRENETQPFISLTDNELLGYRIHALERLANQGDQEKFIKYARLFKETWGDAETLFAPNMASTLEKIKSAQSLHSCHPQNLLRAPHG